MGAEDMDAKPKTGRSLLGIVYFQFLILIMYTDFALLLYSLATFNYEILAVLFAIIFLQGFAKRSEWYVHLMNDTFRIRSLFKKFEVIYDEAIPEEEVTMFGGHVHSVFAVAMACNLNFDHQRLSRAVGLCSRGLLIFPLFGLHLRLWGFQAVEPSNLKKLLRAKKSVALLPGGFEEATLTTPNEFRVFIKSRKGFVKYGLENGYTIRPILFFGEHKAYWTFDYLIKLRLLINKLKFPAVWYFSPTAGTFLPTTMEVTTVVGRGVSIEGVEGKPTKEQVDEVHRKYVEEMERLYSKYKEHNGGTPMAIY